MDIEKLFEEWKKYLTGTLNHQPGQNLLNHSILSTIQLMVDDDFIFRTFHSANLEMLKNEGIYNDLFCSNTYLGRVFVNWYYTTQSLYIRKLTENSARGDGWKKTCSLINLLTSIEKNFVHINREKFRIIHKNNPNIAYADIRFDAISNKDEGTRKDNDEISLNYLAHLKNRLETEEIKKIRSYTDKVVAHSDFAGFKDSFNMETIKKCHEVIIEVFREIESNFFMQPSTFGETKLWKELLLQNADKPFMSNK